MRSYSPIDNVRPGATYPSMLIVSGLNDPRVAYWEPTKWVARLREARTDGRPTLLKMDLAAGHSHSSDRYRYLRELAFEYAFLLEKLCRGSTTPGAVEPPTSVARDAHMVRTQFEE